MSPKLFILNLSSKVLIYHVYYQCIVMIPLESCPVPSYKLIIKCLKYDSASHLWTIYICNCLDQIFLVHHKRCSEESCLNPFIRHRLFYTLIVFPAPICHKVLILYKLFKSHPKNTNILKCHDNYIFLLWVFSNLVIL